MRHGGSVHLAARLAGRVPASHNTRPASRAAKWAALLLPLLATLALAAAAFAQSIDVTATLDITNGLARPGAYVPVHLKATNGTGHSLKEVRIDSGGPVEVVAPWPMAPGEESEIVLPVYCVGGELALTLDFFSAKGARLAGAKAAIRPVQAAPQGTAVVAVPSPFEQTDEAGREALRQALGVQALHFLQLSSEDTQAALQCGLLDAVVADSAPMQQGRAVIVDAKSLRPAVEVPFPPGTLEAVQPQVYSLLGSEAWPATDRLRLWLGLGLFACAVVVAGVLLPRRRARAAVALVALAAGAVAAIWFFGGVHGSRVREARVFHVRSAASQVQGGHPAAALEHLVILESRGGEWARYVVPMPVTTETVSGEERATIHPENSPLPLPLLAASEELFRTQGVLRCGQGRPLPADRSRLLPDGAALAGTKKHLQQTRGESPSKTVCGNLATSFESQVSQTAIRVLKGEAPPFGYAPREWAGAELGKLAERSDLVAALLIEGDRATDAAGKTQPLDAWAVEWRASADADVAFAGRSLAWWKTDRQEGEGPWILAWWHDPLPAGEASKNHERLPALVAYSSAPKP